MDKSEEQVCSCSSFMRQGRYFGSYMEVDAWIAMVGWEVGRGECVCITDSSTGSGARRARATSLKQHQGGMQGPEMGGSTKNQTILWGAFPPPVANSCPYFHSERPPFFKASSSLSLLIVLTCIKRENKSVLVHEWNQGRTLIITRFILSVTQQTFMAFLNIYWVIIKYWVFLKYWIFEYLQWVRPWPH